MARLHLISSGKERGSVGMAADQWGWPDDDSRPGDEGLWEDSWHCWTCGMGNMMGDNSCANPDCAWASELLFVFMNRD